MEATTISMGSTSSDVLQHVADTATHMRPGLTSTQAQRWLLRFWTLWTTRPINTGNSKPNTLMPLPQACGCSVPVGAVPTGSSRCLSVYPTAEGYLVYLGMLDLSPEDAQELMEKMLDLLVRRGRFKRPWILPGAPASSIEFRQLISDKLQQAYRPIVGELEQGDAEPAGRGPQTRQRPPGRGFPDGAGCGRRAAKRQNYARGKIWCSCGKRCAAPVTFA